MKGDCRCDEGVQMQVKNISRNRLDLGPFFRKKGCQAIAKQSPCFPWSVAAAGGGVIGGDRAGGGGQSCGSLPG